MSIKHGFMVKNEMVPPAKGYIHSAGFEELYGSIRKARNTFNTMLLRSLAIPGTLPKNMNPTNADYLVGIIWGDTQSQEPVVDFFGYQDINGWPGNPTVYSWVMRNGNYSSDKYITCGDGLILLGMEEDLRRRMSRECYETTHVDLIELNRRIRGE